MFLDGFAPSIKCQHIHTRLGSRGLVPHILLLRFLQCQNSSASTKTFFVRVLTHIDLHETICFTMEMRHETMCFMEIMSFELARRRRTTTLLFQRRNATRFLLFYERNCSSKTYFLSKIEGENVGGSFGSSSVASASWQVYIVAAAGARNWLDLSSDFSFSRKCGACIQHTTW